MALFQSYAPPGVYTQVQIESAGQSLFGNARIPVIIGEGQQFFQFNNAELIRGSSAIADNQVVDEDLSDQVTGLNNTFQVTYFPITDGTGKGVVTNDPSKIQVTSEGIPLVVVSLNGATGQFVTQEIIPQGDDIHVTYFFKRTDTKVVNEDLSAQIPDFATLVVNAAGGSPASTGVLTFSLTIPGDLGNMISLAFTYTPGHGKSDALAVSGSGSTSISIELLKGDNATIRDIQDILNLVNAGIPTSYGFLTATSTGSTFTPLAPQLATNFSGGAGPQTNTVFKTHFTPIVDGTNGGVTTTNPANVTVLVNGIPVVVTAVDGQHGLVTLAVGVLPGSTLTITYWFNKWAFTYDILPGTVASITAVGLGPNRSDFIQGTDFELNQDGTLIEWGANADTAPGVTNVNSTITFGPAQITTTLVDEQVWLQPVTGSVNGINANFTLRDIPVDGSGLNRPTDNPALIKVYVGPDPITALSHGPVVVSQVSGDAGTFVLYNPPSTGNVYASYWRSQLNDHVFTLTVQTPGVPGQGTYSITNELGQIVPSTTVGAAHVFDAGAFSATGIVWPNNFPDLNAEAGDLSETVTVTFQDDSLFGIIQPAVQATATVLQSGNDSLVFIASTPGAGPNGVTNITLQNNLAPIQSQYQVYTSAGTFSGSTGVATPFAVWQAGHMYTAGQIIYDPTTLSIQIVKTSGVSGGVDPGFSATPGAPSTTTPDGTVVWASNGLAPQTVEQIVVNIVSVGSNPQAITLNGVVALFTGVTGVSGNVVTTPAAGQILATLGSGSLGTHQSVAHTVEFFLGGVNSVVGNYANRFLVTSSIANASGTGQATTPGSPNVDPSGPWTPSTSYAEAQIVSFVVGGIEYLAQAQNSGMSGVGPATPSGGWHTGTGASTTDNTITWITLGVAVTPVGANGYLGQTYVDIKTGVKFTIVDPAQALHYGYTQLPSPQYQFVPGDTLTFTISANQTTPGPFFQPFVTGSTPIINIDGLQVKVTTTFGATVGDTALINTFKGDAHEPNVGSYYFVSYTVAKTATDMSLKLYTNPADAYAVYGQPTVVNRVSLGVQLMAGNGCQQFGVIQVPQQPGLNVASDANYEAAIQSLSMALPGTTNKANVIVPLSTSQPVQQYLSNFLITQAAPRNKGEAIGFIGMGLYNTPSDASALANALHNSRVILVAPFAFGIQITNPTTGVAQEYAVSGEFAAAALAGLNVNPANDVATSLTNQNVVGFSRILQQLDDPTMDLMASNGVTLLVNQSGGLQVRHYKSTDPSNILVSEPTSTTIADFVSQAFRADLKQFIGRKLIGSIIGSIQIVCNGRLKSLVDAQLIQGYSAPQVVQDPTDPTTVKITVTYQPVFTLLYLGVTFTVTSSSVSSSGSATGSGQTGTGPLV